MIENKQENKISKNNKKCKDTKKGETRRKQITLCLYIFISKTISFQLKMLPLGQHLPNSNIYTKVILLWLEGKACQKPWR